MHSAQYVYGIDPYVRYDTIIVLCTVYAVPYRMLYAVDDILRYYPGLEI